MEANRSVVAQFPTAEEIDFVAGERVSPRRGGRHRLDWQRGYRLRIRKSFLDRRPEGLVHKLVDQKVPTLGVCFGHQVVNSALGGTVEEVGTTATLVEASPADDPLFDGVEPVVVSLHGDAVTKLGKDLEIIASADHARVFGTRHRIAPLWTVQFHPEITVPHRDSLVNDFGRESGHLLFEDVTAGRIFRNFARLAVETAT